ncbi:hypothetical protein F5B20DRAFT_1912 [Whalleya microplaca]|nr:hypothetical protein F5B20DRAFT_1912 [Whalleya microplaca]
MTTLTADQKNVLAMSRAQFLDSISAERPADKLAIGVCIFRMDLHTSRPSVLLLRRRPEKARPASAASVSSAYSTSSSPPADKRHSSSKGLWELPGGKVNESDFCISAAVARKVREQTGLKVVRMVGALREMRRGERVPILDWDDDDGGGGGAVQVHVPLAAAASWSSSSVGSVGGMGGLGEDMPMPLALPLMPRMSVRREVLQLNYTVLVESTDDLKFRSKDHDELVWASFSRIEAMRDVNSELRAVVHQALAWAGEFLL